jgi:predicted ArsR family transcriptional regulator
VECVGGLGLEVDFWKLLSVFQSKTRVQIIKLLLRFEWRSLSDIAEKLRSEYGVRITLPGLLKHMKSLEEAGMVRHESGVFAEKPDARKSIYILEGKERIERILRFLEDDVGSNIMAGMVYTQASKLARKIQGAGHGLSKKEITYFESLLDECESEKVKNLLTDDEKKKIRLWRMMVTTILAE